MSLTLVHLIERDDVTIGACVANSQNEFRYMTFDEAKKLIPISKWADVEIINYGNIDYNWKNTSYDLAYMLGLVRTKLEWDRSKLGLGQYLKPGDYVDNEMFDYFLCNLPPEYWSGDILQMGEPISTRQYSHTYATLKKVAGGWVYCGNCYHGQTTNIK